MADKVIRNNESIVPFFGEKMSFIRGLDPLGLQNVSDATFSKLLPGLNNVTGRIRYYSFYCWLLDQYSKTNGSTDPEEQKSFMRRAEFIIALASIYFEGDNSSIPGSNYAKQEINEKHLKMHNLQQGTFKDDGATRDTYWNYPTGAFGQYYLGSLRDIGIISNRDRHVGVYVRTNKREDGVISGELLAEAFENNLSRGKKAIFLKALEDGFISEKNLKGLLPDFDLTVVPEGSPEADLLTKLLMQKDYPLRIEEAPSTLRKQTIKNLLEYIKLRDDEELSDRRFVYHCYDNKGEVLGSKDDCLMGWYYYQFNEFWHVANTFIFNGTLDFLETTAGPNWMPLTHLVKQVTDGVINIFGKLVLSENGEVMLKDLLAILSNEDEYDFLDKGFETKGIKRVANGFLLMFVLYINNQNELFGLKEYSESNEVTKDGEGSDYFLNIFKHKEESTISDFIHDYILINIIYRHQYVAFRKIRGGIQSTQKFIIEDQHIRYLANFEAGFTGPRIIRLISFLTDLGVIKKDTLTEYGEQFFINLKETI